MRADVDRRDVADLHGRMNDLAASMDLTAVSAVEEKLYDLKKLSVSLVYWIDASSDLMIQCSAPCVAFLFSSNFRHASHGSFTLARSLKLIAHLTPYAIPQRLYSVECFLIFLRVVYRLTRLTPTDPPTPGNAERETPIIMGD